MRKTTDDIKIAAFEALIKELGMEVGQVELGKKYLHPSSKRRIATVHKTGRIVRVKRHAKDIIEVATAIFGPENGEASEMHQDTHATWWFNGKTYMTKKS